MEHNIAVTGNFVAASGQGLWRKVDGAGSSCSRLTFLCRFDVSFQSWRKVLTQPASSGLAGVVLFEVRLPRVLAGSLPRLVILLNLSFNSKLSGVFLKGEVFYSLKEIQVLAERWLIYYNTEQPYS